MGRRPTSRAVLGAYLLLLGCGSSQGSDPFAVGQGSSGAENAAGAGITAAAAGVAWAVGGGCRLQGCPYGTYCDETTGFCQVRKCSEGCPGGTVCNEGLDRCQAVPPARNPTDLLPQDNKVANPPGVH